MFGIKITSLGIDDVNGQVEHVLWDLLVGDLIKIVCLLPNLVRIAKGDPEHTLVAGFQCDDVLTGSENHLADGDHTFFANGFSNDRESLLANIAIRGNVIGISEVHSSICDFGTNSSMSIVRLLSIATASSSSGWTSTYSPLA